MSALLKVCVATQTLSLYRERRLQTTYPVSTALAGVGQQMGSFQTPLGWHQIRAKIGSGMPMDTVFKARRPVSGSHHSTSDDVIMARILWLCGLEPGINRFGSVDTMRRYIYIHGTSDVLDGKPRSLGCVRMKPKDVVKLFDQVSSGTRVHIQAPAVGGA